MLRRAFLTLFFLTSSALAQDTDAPHGNCAVEWEPLAAGIDYRAITCLGDRDDIDVHVVRIDSGQFLFNVADVTNGSFAKAEASKRNAVFVINANFFQTDRTPIGVIVRDGDELQPSHRSTWQSIFLVDEDGDPAIIRINEWPQHRDEAQMAVQAGPRIIVKGHTNRVNRSYHAARVGVCIQKSGDLFFFATPRDRKFDMWEIGRIARRSEKNGGLGCHDAMLFDGGHSTQMFVAGDSKTIRVDGDPVPVFVFATRRNASSR